MKDTTRWHSSRLGEDMTVVRWGTFGKPVLLFPTAGGDAEEVERFHLIDVLAPLIGQGRIKVYSCDSIAGQWLVSARGTPAQRCLVQNLFQQAIAHEVVPAIRADCRSPDIDVIATGASIGAFHALAVLCRWPELFSHAIGMSGTYDIARFVNGPTTDDLFFATPLWFLSGMNGAPLERLRTRLAIIAAGEGRAENIGESWNIANALGQKGVPNRVDSWGADWHHDWVTWRKMLPQYLAELTESRAEV
jgi:esterase/lipase superfamily enzyme